jgi:hypothetical protein
VRDWQPNGRFTCRIPVDPKERRRESKSTSRKGVGVSLSLSADEWEGEVANRLAYRRRQEVATEEGKEWERDNSAARHVIEASIGGSQESPGRQEKILAGFGGWWRRGSGGDDTVFAGFRHAATL